MEESSFQEFALASDVSLYNDSVQAEFQAEQEYLQTLSFLSPAEQEKYKERQGVQFLYMKPPGADSMPPVPAVTQVV